MLELEEVMETPISTRSASLGSSRQGSVAPEFPKAFWRYNLKKTGRTGGPAGRELHRS